ncbi:MAG: hypothetical protein EZS28_054104, partial [Streblomastix strix]
DIGAEKGKYYSINVPLRDGIDDDRFIYVFQAIISCAIESHQPTSIVLQCGVDSLAQD